ncbi:MAG: 3-deoxy-manno-octulosonate cytidylyltransferase (CMP-KDO synthetase) [Arenicella sp.]|jgi:3-deoxy-manno-octulosonate cytidylyltransferase (CMP-KDO synthetase)
MSFTVVIPARYASTRLPGKALADIHGKPMIAHVVDRARESSASRVIVATDDQRIADAVSALDCEVCMTRAEHQSGSDRIAEVVEQLGLEDHEIVVNVQGDEPLIPGKLIDQVASALEVAGDAAMSTAAKEIDNEADIANPNIVKVVFSRAGRALYFSRAPIPYARDQRVGNAWHHIGIYAYRASFLKRYDQLLDSAIEQTECLEQLRVLDNGDSIMVETVDYDTGVGVDTAEDLERVISLMSR